MSKVQGKQKQQAGAQKKKPAPKKSGALTDRELDKVTGGMMRPKPKET